MTMTVHTPIASGTLYTVTDVAGHPPVSIIDFVGRVEFHIQANGAPYRVAGTGIPGSTTVLRFYEIVTIDDHEDVRIWDISASPGAGVVAYQVDGPIDPQ